MWIDVNTPETNMHPGYKNEGELEAIDWLLKALEQADGYKEFQNSQTKPEDKEIGIITFYSAQSREIKKNTKAVLIELMLLTDSKEWNAILLSFRQYEAMRK